MTVRVAAGVMQNGNGEVLIARRPSGSHMEGAWEFPGGKIEQAETPLQGLVRELQEELAVTVRCARYLACYQHDYPERSVRLHFWRILEWQGEPVGAEGQELVWVLPDALLETGLLPADKPVVDLLLQQVPVINLQGLRAS